ncbi:MAG: ABC transporter ATP-binding protein [Thermaerobacter sp.]|nr:ABC transporter ATP-binding protein [Thermaerobacter sp.]
MPERLSFMDYEDPAIRTESLSKRYGRKAALSDLTMTVPRGEVFGFLGPNGAGKTTAVKLLLGLARPTAGEGLVLGEPLGAVSARQHIGYLPELFRYQDWLTAQEVLEAHGALLHLSRAARRTEAESALSVVGLADRAKDRVGAFSKGMQQRLGLAVALIGSPQMVVLDEPTSALDPVGRHDVREIIRHLKQRGATIFLNSHLLSEVELVCDRVAVLDRGRVAAEGSLEELLAATGAQIEVEGLTAEALSDLRRFGEPRLRGTALEVEGIRRVEVPELVAALCASGARVYAVELRRATLEERFLGLLGGH